ncbi:MAG: NAD-dependent succinate-semialdehyde dehydrogenase [Chloroflexota bacterium]|nr:NAD-dependent succinate-semialdehyde dehydrogenase [Chloroflexota bacterium]MDE2854677.1 NAD-dependent succinate-semialdehyde dehydrogenase [Chloroflexota bacterium]MDE2946041.1 NAD-dependent succinate-semialdehyde dehydrogenase [Chloroflexota bacterium]
MIYKMLINGQWREAADGGTWQVVNPATEMPIADVPFGGAEETTQAITAAHEALPGWQAMTAYERCGILRDIADALRARADELGPIMTAECGKPIGEATGEWGACADLFDWFAEEGKRAYGRTIPARKAGKRLLVIPQPVGVVATITAWNFPAFLLARKWAGALAAGCTIVGRPSELTPMSAMALVNVMVEAGLPPGVVNLINGDPQIMGETILSDPRVRKLSFTGSQRVGRLLMRGAAAGIKKLSLELGGSAPVLVFADSDMNWAAEQGVIAKFRNNGQVCISPARFYVEQPALEDFLEAAKHESEKLVVGDGMQAHVTNGPMVSRAGRDKVELFVQDALEKRASLVAGGGRPSIEKGYFYQPTVLTDVTADMRIGCDEVFGPVMAVSAFSTLDEALQLANDTPFGLAGYVMTKDLSTATRIYEGLDFGIIGVNDLVPATAEAPFGGVKTSGFGREAGQEGLTEYMDQKFVSIGLD